MKKYALRGMLLLGALLAVGAVILIFCTPGKKPAGGGDNATGIVHDHETAAVLDVSYALADDGTFTLIIKNCEGEELLTKTGLKQKAVSEPVNDTVFSLSWATGTGANDYERIYCNRMTCQVSEVFVSPFASDGTRVVLPQGNNKDGYSVLIRDVFDAKGYSMYCPLKDAYTEGDQAVVFGGKLVKEGFVSVSYLVGANGEHRIVEFDLYADKTTESKPTTSTTTTKK